jgi:pimeloyl-ACP methyl ester carboxylesterase
MAEWPALASGLLRSELPLPSGATLQLVTGGPDDGPPVVLVHGWGIHSYLWRKNLPALLQAGHRVVALDLPGHGGSSLPAPGGMTLDAQVAQLVALLDALALPRVALLGQSMGGRICLELAMRAPARVSRLVLFGSVGLGEAPPGAPLASRVPFPQGLPADKLLRRWMVHVAKYFAYGTRGTFTEADVDAYWSAAQRPGVIAALWQALAEFDWRVLSAAELQTVAAPTLVLFGTRDRTISPRGVEARVAQLPRGEMCWVRDAGHVVCEECPDEVNPRLVEFLGREG